MLTSTESCLAKHARARSCTHRPRLCSPLLSDLFLCPDAGSTAARTSDTDSTSSSIIIGDGLPVSAIVSIATASSPLDFPGSSPRPTLATAHRTPYTVQHPASTGANGLGDDCPPPNKSASASHRIPASPHLRTAHCLHRTSPTGRHTTHTPGTALRSVSTPASASCFPYRTTLFPPPTPPSYHEKPTSVIPTVLVPPIIPLVRSAIRHRLVPIASPHLGASS